MSRPKGDAREMLLSAAIGHVAENGLSDLSLRQLAAALGTSHRMLIYHFGSKEELLVGVVRALERQYQEMVESWISVDEGQISPTEELRRIWRFVTDPARAPYPYERLFYELYGQALQGRPHTDGFLEGNVDAWIDHVSRIFRGAGLSPATARDEARLAVARIDPRLSDLRRRRVDHTRIRAIAHRRGGTTRCPQRQARPTYDQTSGTTPTRLLAFALIPGQARRVEDRHRAQRRIVPDHPATVLGERETCVRNLDALRFAAQL